jgi:hypothetical protein
MTAVWLRGRELRVGDVYVTTSGGVTLKRPITACQVRRQTKRMRNHAGSGRLTNRS